MFEHYHEKILPRSLFLKRLAKYAAISFGLGLACPVIGMVGYNAFEGSSWVDSFLNAAMLLGGMGPLVYSLRMEENISLIYMLYTSVCSSWLLLEFLPLLLYTGSFIISIWIATMIGKSNFSRLFKLF